MCPKEFFMLKGKGDCDLKTCKKIKVSYSVITSAVLLFSL